MRNAGGFAETILPGARTIERDTYTCGHCQNISFTENVTVGGTRKLQVLLFRSDGSHVMADAGFCRNCFRHICPRCDGKPCVPFEKRLDDEERSARGLIICR